MVIIKDFKSTNIWNAFILNALAVTVTIMVALLIKMRYDKFTDIHGNVVTHTSSTRSIVTTLVVTFFAAFGAYAMLHVIFGYGGGMLVTTD